MNEGLIKNKKQVIKAEVEIKNSLESKKIVRRTLKILGFASVIVGLLMFFTGTLPDFEARFGWVARVTISSIALSAGICLIMGSRKKTKLESLWNGVGLSILGLFYTLMFGAALLLVLSSFSEISVSLPFTEISADKPRPYVASIYFFNLLWLVSADLTSWKKMRNNMIVGQNLRGE